MDTQFLLERYKYILEQKRELNKTTFKVAAIFQAIMIATISCQFTLIAGVYAHSLPHYVVRAASIALIVASSVTTAFCVLSILGGLASWLKYRRDESEIEIIVHGSSRQAPRWKDWFRWYETYVLMVIIITEMLFCVGVTWGVLPYL